MSSKYDRSSQFPDLMYESHACMHLVNKLLEICSGDIGQHLNQVIKINITSEGEIAIVASKCDTLRRTHHFCSILAKNA